MVFFNEYIFLLVGGLRRSILLLLFPVFISLCEDIFQGGFEMVNSQL